VNICQRRTPGRGAPTGICVVLPQVAPIIRAAMQQQRCGAAISEQCALRVVV